MRALPTARPRSGRRARDHASLPVMEGLLIAALMAGAIAFVLSFPNPTHGSARPVANLESQAGDAMTILAGLHAPEGSEADSFLEAAVLDALQGDSTNLTTKLRALLPEGASFNLYLDNGLSPRPLSPLVTPGVERVSVDYILDPHWNGVYLYTGFSSYPTNASVDVLGFPILNSVNLSTREAPRVTLTFPNGWTTQMSPGPNGSLVKSAPPAQGGATGAPALANGWVGANSTRFDHRLLGNATYSVSSHATLAATFATMRTGLDASTLALPREPVRLGSTGSLSWNFTPLLTSLGGAYVPGSANVTLTLQAPVPNGTRFGGTIPEWTTTGQPAAGAVSMPVASEAFLGSHLLVADIAFQVQGSGGTFTQHARLAGIVPVGLQNGGAVLAPAYRVVLEAWFSTWT